MAWFPKARKMNIRPGSNDPAIEVVGAILHVDAGNARSLFRYFNGPSGGIESHFHVAKDGTIEQYRNTGYEADANYKANSFWSGGRRKGYISIETQGYGSGEWTPEQVEAIKAILVWASAEHGFPLEKASGPYSGGVGYHTQFPDHWTPYAKSCPGPDRIRQFHTVFVPWFKEGGSTLSWNHEFSIWGPDHNPKGDMPMDQQVQQARGFAEDAYRRVRGLEAMFTEFVKSFGPEVQERVEAALERAEVDLAGELSVSFEPEGSDPKA